MSKRCTATTMMYAGGMVDLHTNYVYYLNREGVISRITNTLQLRNTTTGPEFPIIISEEELSLSVDEFKERSKGRKLATSIKATGADHLDKPVTTGEKLVRKSAIDKVFKIYAKVSSRGVEDLMEEYEAKVDSIMDRIGSDIFVHEFNFLISNGKAKTFSNVVAYLNSLESLEERAYKISNKFSKENNKSDVIAKMNITPNAKVELPLEVDWSLWDSISDHAYARWLERVEGLVDLDLVNKAANVYLSENRAGKDSVTNKARVDFKSKCETLGIDRERGANIRNTITEYLSSDTLRFSPRKPNTESNAIDRFNAYVETDGKILEFTLFPYEFKTDKQGRKTARVKVLSVLDRTYSKTSIDTFAIKEITTPTGETVALDKAILTGIVKGAERSLASMLK